MKVGFLSLALIIAILAGAPGGLESANRTAFAQSQPRNQTQSQDGLPEPQKRKISNIGPEDVLPMNEPGENQNRSARGQQTQQRKPPSTPSFPPSPTQRTPPTSAPAPSATASAQTSSAGAIQAPAETPSPAIPSAGSESGIQPTIGEADSTVKVIRWTVPGLVALALIVLAALIFTLTKLLEKIRETSSG
jgi:hypothetical protein